MGGRITVYGLPGEDGPAGWRPAHVGLANDGFRLDGLDVWALWWRSAATATVVLTDPADGEPRLFRIFDVDDGHRATRFAAAQRADGRWIFHCWHDPFAPLDGVSADGSLCYRNGHGPLVDGRYDAVLPVASITDLVTGTELFDGTAWESSRVTALPDGSLLLDLTMARWQAVFRIEPVGRSFRDLADAAPPRPLAELPDAVGEARAVAMTKRAFGRQIAPDGSLVVEIEWAEWSNSLWVQAPRVVEVATGRVLLDLWDTDWDTVVEFPAAGTVYVALQRFRTGGTPIAQVEFTADRYRMTSRGETQEGLTNDLHEALEERCAGWRPAACCEGSSPRRG